MKGYFYKDRFNFMISILDKKQKDVIYLFQAQENKSMRGNQGNRLDASCCFLINEDTFEIPVIDFDR